MCSEIFPILRIDIRRQPDLFPRFMFSLQQKQLCRQDIMSSRHYVVKTLCLYVGYVFMSPVWTRPYPAMLLVVFCFTSSLLCYSFVHSNLILGIGEEDLWMLSKLDQLWVNWVNLEYDSSMPRAALFESWLSFSQDYFSLYKIFITAYALYSLRLINLTINRQKT